MLPVDVPNLDPCDGHRQNQIQDEDIFGFSSYQFFPTNHTERLYVSPGLFPIKEFFWVGITYFNAPNKNYVINATHGVVSIVVI